MGVDVIYIIFQQKEAAIICKRLLYRTSTVLKENCTYRTQILLCSYVERTYDITFDLRESE